MVPETTDGVEKSPDISVVIMAYNECASIQPTVAEVVEALVGLGICYEVLIVDDGSRDGTGAIADSLEATQPLVRVVHHAENSGLGAVYRTGFTQARGEYLTFFPADGQFPASILPQFVALMPGRDMVLGFLSEAGRSVTSRVLSAIERTAYRALFGTMPRFQGVLMFRRKILGELRLVSTGRGWAVLMELIIRAARAEYRIISVPTTFRPRRMGRSKVNNLQTIWANLRQLGALRKDL